METSRDGRILFIHQHLMLGTVPEIDLISALNLALFSADQFIGDC